LQPPLNTLPGGLQRFSSWIDDHMPEMLWAVLVAGVFDRDDLLGCLRVVISAASPWFANTPSPAPTRDLDDDSFNDTKVLDHTALAELDDEKFQTVVDIIRKHPLGPAALRPLLLINSLPGLDRWKVVLGMEPTAHDWQTLGLAVANVLDHQSQTSTDIRWFKVMFRIRAGGMFFTQGMEETARETFEYPNRGDQRKVRASIRATEMMMRRRPPSAWTKKFWNEAAAAQKCIDPSEAHEYLSHESQIDRSSIYIARVAVIRRFFLNRGAERIDSRLDAAFGLVLYALALADEVATSHSQSGILGRLALRSLFETAVTHAYLLHTDTTDSWMAYRTYGNAQAKLAFLKAQEIEGDLPSFLDEDALHAIANEDVWQEYLDIGLGDWEKRDNRKRAEVTGLKDSYNKYYGWASAFVHGNWGAVRDTNFVTCHNPLHRLHRIPRLLHRTLASADTDIVELVNGVIARLDCAYKGDEILPLITCATSPRPASPSA